MKIKNKLILLYSLLFIASMIISIFLYQRIHRRIMMEEIKNSSEEMVRAVGQNIEKSLDRINVYSKIILSNQNVQSMLNTSSQIDKLAYTRNFYRFISDITINYPEIAGIYVIDNKGAFFFQNKTDGYLSLRKLEIKKNITEKNDWYRRVEAADGRAIFQVKKGVISFDNTEEVFFTSSRVINDINSQKPIGMIVIDFKKSVIENAVTDLDVNDSRLYTLYDENGQVILSAGGNEKVRHDLDKHIYYGEADIDFGNWRFEYIVHNSAFYKESKRISIFILSMIVINSIILLIGAALISSGITRPISILTDTMKRIELGKLEEMTLKTSIPEFNVLKDGYNKMLKKIDQLLKNIITEQRKKRKAELEVLQAQIRPHFLYNTIDSINALALMRDYEKIYKLSTALGQFYRTSLSGGNEVIRIGEEIELVENYLLIQQIRYWNKFKVTYNVEEDVIDEPILKLILQPFVENALYHGIKPKEGMGTISIHCYKKNEHIFLEVADDGVGMQNPQKVLAQKNNSFGVKGTIERLQFFAGVKDVITFESTRNEGTRVTLKIPCERSNIYGEYEEFNDC